MGRKLNTIVFLLFFLLVVVPIIYTFGTAVFLDKALIDNLQSFNKATLYLLLKSMGIAAAIAFFSTIMGTILAFLLYKTNVRFTAFFKLTLLIPLFISPYILAVSWKDFFHLFLHHSSVISSPIGLVLILWTIYTPLSILIIGSALGHIDRQLEEAAYMVTSRQRMLFKIILPLIKPALMTSFVLVFIFSISEFSVPAFLGVKVFTTEIFTQFSAFYNHSLAILQSGVLVLICIFLLLSESRYIANAPFFSMGNQGSNTQAYPLRKWKSISLFLLTGWLFFTAILPFMVLTIPSIKGGFPVISKAFNLLSTTFLHSITLALTGATIIVFSGFVAAYGKIRLPSHASHFFDGLLLFTFAIPSTILGISYIKFYNQPALNFIYSSSAIILLAYIGKFTFISSKLIGNAIKQIPPSLEEAGQISGISTFTSLRKILIPLILPSIFIAFIISFILCLGELGMTIMLYPPGTELMPIKVFTIMANAPQSLTSAMSLIVFSVTLLLIASLILIMNWHKKHTVSG